MTRAQKIGACLIGVVFLLSGIGKALNVLLFQSLIHSYGLPYLDLVAPLVVATELLLAFLFLARERVKTISLWSIILLLVFTGVYTFGLTRQGITDCGCFGVLHVPDIPPVYVYARNILLLIVLNWLYFTAEDEPQPWSRARWIAFSGYMGLTLFCTGMTFRPAAFLPSRPHPLEGKAISETPLCEQVPQRESVMVLLYSYQCGHCMNTMENFLALQRYERVDTIIAVAVVPEDAEVDSLRQTLRQRYPELGTLEMQAGGIVQIQDFPTALLVENDTIRQVISGELPSPYSIETIKTSHK